MTDQEFLSLCTETSQLLELDDVDVLGKAGEVVIDDIRIGLYYIAETDEVISCFVDAGYLDDALRPAAFEHMLAFNLEINGANGESLGFDRKSGHLILKATIRPELECTPDQLADWLRDYAEFTHNLREILSAADGQFEFKEMMPGALA